jgi:hypothetical protein
MEANVAGTTISVVDDTTLAQVHEIYRKSGGRQQTLRAR